MLISIHLTLYNSTIKTDLNVRKYIEQYNLLGGGLKLAKYCKLFVLSLMILIIPKFPLTEASAENRLSSYELTSEQQLVLELLWPQNTKIYELVATDNNAEPQFFTVYLEKLTDKGWQQELLLEEIPLTPLKMAFTLASPVKISYATAENQLTKNELDSLLLPDATKLLAAEQTLKIHWFEDIALEEGKQVVALIEMVNPDRFYNENSELNDFDYEAIVTNDSMIHRLFALILEIN